MREILFRGKRMDNGEWIEGFYTKSPKGNTYITQTINGKASPCVVDSETIGQYTGLKDKKGKRIFEGDIVVYDNSPYNVYCSPHKGEIVWHKWAWRLKYFEHGSVYYYSLGSEDFFGAKSEVIGNIHDNPELLEGGIK